MKTKTFLSLVILSTSMFISICFGQTQFDYPKVQSKEYCKSLEIIKATFSKANSIIKCRYKNTDQAFMNFCLSKSVLMEYNGKISRPATHNDIQQKDNYSEIEFVFPFINEPFNSINFYCDDDTCFNFINVSVNNNPEKLTNVSTNSVVMQSSNGLKFSKAVFITRKSEGVSDHIAFNETIKVDKGKVLNITSSQVFMVKRQYKLYIVRLSVWINDQPIYSCFKGINVVDINGSSIWLPEGTYDIKVQSLSRYENRNFYFYLSGVEYTVEK